MNVWVVFEIPYPFSNHHMIKSGLPSPGVSGTCTKDFEEIRVGKSLGFVIEWFRLSL